MRLGHTMHSDFPPLAFIQPLAFYVQACERRRSTSSLQHDGGGLCKVGEGALPVAATMAMVDGDSIQLAPIRAVAAG